MRGSGDKYWRETQNGRKCSRRRRKEKEPVIPPSAEKKSSKKQKEKGKGREERGELSRSERDTS